MKKTNQKGFMLAETLIVSTFIIGTLVFLFAQFRTVNQGYQITFNYNTVNALYAAENIQKFYRKNSFTTIKDKLNNESLKYIDLTDCRLSTEQNYCDTLIRKLKVKRVLFITENTSRLINSDEFNDLEPTMKSFIKYIKVDDDTGKYRLVVELDDGTFASVKIY